MPGIFRKKIPDSLAGDAFRLQIQDNSFDAVFYFGVIEHLYEPEGMFLEFARILQKGGGLMLTTPSAWAWSNMSKHRLLGRFPAVVAVKFTEAIWVHVIISTFLSHFP
nr:class I SAM-dependent methyltransferase [Desulfobacterales bacterium]